MKKKINQEVMTCALEQEDNLNCTADNTHIITGISFMGLLAILNLILIF